MTLKYQLKWTEEHDKIVAEYERRKKEGKEKVFVLIPRDV